MSKIMTWHVKEVTILRRNVPVVCGASYHLLGYRILQDSKIRFWLQVKSHISHWLFSGSQLLASYVSRHKAMAYDSPDDLDLFNLSTVFPPLGVCTTVSVCTTVFTICWWSPTQNSCVGVIFVLAPTRMLTQNWRNFDTSPTCCQHVTDIPS